MKRIQKIENSSCFTTLEKNAYEVNFNNSNKEIYSNREFTQQEKPKITRGVQQRYIFCLLGFIGFFNLFAMRVILSVTLVAMVKDQTLSEHSIENDHEMSCPALLEESTLGNASYQNIPNEIRGNFDWDSNIQHLVIGSFYYGYFVTQLPGGILSEKYGAKLVFTTGMAITTIITLLTPVLAKWSVWALIVARILNGVGEGVTYPAMTCLLARWTPTMERSMATTLIGSGSTVGTFVSMIIAGELCASVLFGGWPSVFYIFGALGCIACILWVFLVHEYPDSHPRISKAELQKIQISLGERQHDKPLTPWKAIFTSVPIWALICTHFGQNWGFYMLLNETPLYLSNVLFFNIEENGMFSAVPNFLQLIIAIVTSLIADKLRSTGCIRNNYIRKIINSIGLYGSAMCMVFIPYAGCNAYLTTALFSLAMGINGCTYAGLQVTHIDMSPEFAGTLMGITNTFANIPGFLAPSFVGWIVSYGNTLENWGIAYVTSALILTLSGTIYNFFCRIELQPWSPSYEHFPEQFEESRKRSLSDLI